jgi:hypothetical protein
VSDKKPRDPLDAYWTPFGLAYACLEAAHAFVAQHHLDVMRASEDGYLAAWSSPSWNPKSMLEPSVGGGAWVGAARCVLPTAWVHRVDLDPNAPGLTQDVRRISTKRKEEAVCGNFLHLNFVGAGTDCVFGNPPYSPGIAGRSATRDPLTWWFDRSLTIAPVVGYLLRGTALGSVERLPWWRANPPACIWTVSQRPAWEGPGARAESDSSDPAFVLWIRGVTDTRHRWLDEWR